MASDPTAKQGEKPCTHTLNERGLVGIERWSGVAGSKPIGEPDVPAIRSVEA